MSLIGMQLGHYTLTRLIGSGGMGEVYLAEDIRTHRQVAIKVLRGELAASSDAHTTQEAERLFQREMSIIISLDHPHILPLYDYGEEVKDKITLTYMVMPYRQEGSIDDWLQRRNTNEPLSPQDMAFLLQQAGEALQYAHDHNIIHRDVKTSNFLIWETKERPDRPNLLLADFGIAKLHSTTPSSQSVRGTPAYMPPEQWDGHPVFASDQYALAVMAYFLLTKHRPFAGKPMQAMQQHSSIMPQPPSTYNPRISPAIDAVILRALEKSPTDRYPSISAFVNAFQQALLDKPARFVPPVRPMPNLATPQPPTPTGGDLHATLSVTLAEAFTGSMRSLQLPGGRFVSVQVPPRAYDHQVIRLDGIGEPQYPNGPAGAVIITLAVAPVRRENTPNNHDSGSISRPVSTSGNQDKQSGGLNDIVSDPYNSPTVISKPQPFSAPIPPPPPPPPTSSRPNKRIVIIALAILAIIIVLSSGTIFAINTINSSNGNNANATSTAISSVGTAHVNATNTALAKNVAATASARAQATATFIKNNPNPYSSNMHTITLVDRLNGNNSQWTTGNDPAFGGSCQFTNNALRVTESKTGIFYNCTSQSIFSNFTFEVHMKVLQGGCGGIVFRENANAGQFYQFFVCPDILPFYRLVLYVNSTGKNASNLIGNSFPSAIKGGTGVDNTLAVVANGHSILLFVNHSQVGSITDNHYSQGVIGLFADDTLNTTEVAYSNARLWT